MLDYGASQYPDWAAMSGEQFEAHVKQLLKHQYPPGHGVDGKGGDRGRDFVVQLPGGCHVFQMKAVSHRINAGWKRKIKASFDELADQSDVVRWTLVVPIELTDREQEWFAETFTNDLFDTSYEDVTWLRNMIDDNPALRFSMLEVGSARAIVQDNLASVGNPVANARDLNNAADKLAEVGAMLSQTHVVLPTIGRSGNEGFRLERQDGQPDRIDLTILASHIASDAVEDLNWGRPTTFDCSVSVLDAAIGFGGLLMGLAGEGTSGRVRAGGTTGPPVELVLEAVNKNGSVCHKLVLQERSATIGPTGTELRTSDRSGWMKVTLHAVPGDKTVLDVRHRAEGAAYPEDVIDSCNFLHGCVGNNLRFKLWIGSEEVFASDAVPVEEPMWDAPAAFLTYIEDVTWLQNYAGVRHRITFEAAEAEHREVHRIAQLLKGETVAAVGGSITAHVPDIPAKLLDPEGVAMVFDEEFEDLVVQGTEYPVGLHRRRWTCERAIVQNLDEAQAAYEAGESCAVVFSSAPGSGWTAMIGRIDDSGGTERMSSA